VTVPITRKTNPIKFIQVPTRAGARKLYIPIYNDFSDSKISYIYLQTVWTFPDAFALVHVSSARKTMSGRVWFVTTASAKWMATVQPAVLAPTDFVGPAQVSGAADIRASFALRWIVAAYHVNVVAHSVSDLAPIDRRRVTQFYTKKLTLNIILKI